MQTDNQLLQRITTDKRIMTGKPVIKGTRLTVEYMLNLLAHGASFDEILAEYPGIEQNDILACLLFSYKRFRNIKFIPL